jgi:hypothetical protein
MIPTHWGCGVAHLQQPSCLAARQAACGHCHWAAAAACVQGRVSGLDGAGRLMLCSRSSWVDRVACETCLNPVNSPMARAGSACNKRYLLVAIHSMLQIQL